MSADVILDKMTAIAEAARQAFAVLRLAPAAQRSQALYAAAAALKASKDEVLAANALDIAAARANGLSEAMIDRLALNANRLTAIVHAVEQIAAGADPVGKVLAQWTRSNGLHFSKVAVPIGVIGVIFEARPNVAADAAAIALRSGNAVILRAGSEALASAVAIGQAFDEGLRAAGLPPASVTVIDTADRDAVGAMLTGLGGRINLIIPRGGKSLVARVQAEARAPVLGHLEGLCHTFTHASADLQMAERVLINAKLRRVSVCGATETWLVDRAGAARLLPPLAGALVEAGCELRGDPESIALFPMVAATEADYRTEHLAAILNVKIVDGVAGAIAHIAQYGSGHTDAIIASDPAAQEQFLTEVDSAIVLVNASTQYADGGEFGFGAEIGISTDRLHARGPVGPEQLTTFHYRVRGDGQARP